MRFFLIFILVVAPLCASDPVKPKQDRTHVYVLGMIHSGHKTSTAYSIPFLKQLIREINPDVVLTELPPNRFQQAMTQWRVDGAITEARVKRFPEYMDALFPLSKEMDFEIVPTAAWTKPMAEARRDRLKAIEKDPKRATDWQAYEKAMAVMEKKLAALGAEDDPLVIHSPEYDAAIRAGFAVYDKRFNAELGLGGWTHINTGHYNYIAEALDRFKGQGKRVLITYGSAHKYWFIEKLHQRDDIFLEDVRPYIRKLQKQ